MPRMKTRQKMNSKKYKPTLQRLRYMQMSNKRWEKVCYSNKQALTGFTNMGIHYAALLHATCG